ncbi:MAG TPA: methyltransferase domain-containing protein [Methylomirabilota bacterium]|jgi:ubiquinone/menaquinone biosynthesis C-methylase UbiE
MPDVFDNIERAPLPMLEMIAHVLELRASMPQQQEMQRTYLRDIEFPEGARVLEVGCGTGAIARVLAGWPKVKDVLGVDPSPYLVDRARALNPGLPNLIFEVGDGRSLGLKGASVDVVIMHTVLTHVQGPELMLTEARRVLRPGGWLGVCDGDFSTATLATGDLDPLEVCVEAFVDGFVQDRWMVRRMSGLASAAGFAVSPLRSYGLLETTKPGLTLTWVDRGTDVLVGRGRISPELAAALKAEATRRAAANAFFGYMAYASMVGRKPPAGS